MTSSAFRSKYGILTTILVKVLPFSQPFHHTVTSTSSTSLALVTLCHPLTFLTTGVYFDSSSRLYSTGATSSSSSSSSSEDAVEKYSNTRNNKTRFISFVTDIEGDKRYFDRFVENSSILEFESVEPNLTPGLDFFPYDRRVTFKYCYDKNAAHHDDENDDDIHQDSINNYAGAQEDHDVDRFHSILVFGGDVCDKGGNDLYVIRQLLSLKKRFQTRVHFIMGNRDINKMRILQELGSVPTRGRIGNGGSNTHREDNSQGEILYPHGGVYWFQNTGLQGDPALIDEWFCGHDDDDKSKRKGGSDDDDQRVHALIPDRPAERLKWMLKKTMGSPDAFEFRRNELKQEKIFLAQRQVSSGEEESINVSDEEVVESYRQTCHPVTGILGKYLSEGKLCLIIGGAMFMHGSLPVTPHVLARYNEKVLSVGRDDVDAKKEFWHWFFRYATPFKDNVAPTTVNEWVNELNLFARQQNEAWTRNVTLSEEHGHDDEKSMNCKPYNVFWSTVGGYNTLNQNSDVSMEFGSLCQYGMGWLPDKSRNPTVVYNGWMVDGKPKYYNVDDEYLRAYRGIVEDFFNMAGLDVIASGHQPVGDIPFPIQISNGCAKEGNRRRFVICADTSYSGDTKWMNNVKDGRQNRGRGISVSGRGDFAVSEILLEQDCESLGISSIRVRGTLSDGSHHESINYLEGDTNYIGKPVDRNIFSFEGSIQDDSYDNVQWYVKSKLQEGNYLVSTGKGYEVYNSVAKLKK